MQQLQRQPKISVVIPTLNEERDLPRLLDALDTQSFRDFEVIIADANSPDRTRDIAHARGCRIVDGGLPGAGRNAGAAAARGELLLFLDADVSPESDFLTRAVREFEERDLDIATAPAAPLKNHVADALILSTYNAYVLLTQHFWPHAPGFCILTKKILHDAMEGFDESITVVEDADYAHRAGRRGRFGVLVTTHIAVSTRRFESDGRFLTSLKYLMMDMHRALFGEVRHDGFSYKFGHHYTEEERRRIVDILNEPAGDVAKRAVEVIRRQMSLFDY